MSLLIQFKFSIWRPLLLLSLAALPLLVCFSYAITSWGLILFFSLFLIWLVTLIRYEYRQRKVQALLFDGQAWALMMRAGQKDWVELGAWYCSRYVIILNFFSLQRHSLLLFPDSLSKRNWRELRVLLATVRRPIAQD